MSIIGKDFYEVIENGMSYDEYVITPEKYTFNKIASKMAMIKDAVKHESTTIKPTKYKKIGKIIDFATFITYHYNFGYNCTKNNFNLKYFSTILIIESTKHKIKYFDISNELTKEPAYIGENITKITAQEISDEEIKKEYSCFNFNKHTINSKYAGYFCNDRVSPILEGYCFEGTICLPFTNKKYNKYIDEKYDPEKSYKNVNYISLKMFKNINKFTDYYHEFNNQIEYEIYEIYEPIAKEYIVYYIENFFNNMEKAKKITLNNLKVI